MMCSRMWPYRIQQVTSHTCMALAYCNTSVFLLVAPTSALHVLQPDAKVRRQ